MKSEATTPSQYLAGLEEDRRVVVSALRDVINAHIPEGYTECISYGMIGWVVPKSLYPDGYHCTPELPLPFVNLASQKNHIAVYHMGIYSDEALMQWFVDEYPRHMNTKLNMGKSCIRFTNMKKIPYDLIGELMTKMTPQEWIVRYESAIRK